MREWVGRVLILQSITTRCEPVLLSPPCGPWDCVLSGLHPRTNPAFSQFHSWELRPRELTSLSPLWTLSMLVSLRRRRRMPSTEKTNTKAITTRISSLMLYRLLLERVTSHNVPQIRTHSMVPHVRHRDQHVSTSTHNVSPRHVQKYPHTYSWRVLFSQLWMIAIAEKLNFERRPTQMCGE